MISMLQLILSKPSKFSIYPALSYFCQEWYCNNATCPVLVIYNSSDYLIPQTLSYYIKHFKITFNGTYTNRMQLFYEDNQNSLKIFKKFSNQLSLRKFGMLFVTE